MLALSLGTDHYFYEWGEEGGGGEIVGQLLQKIPGQ